MTYNKRKSMVFIESKLFSSLVKQYLSDDEYRELQEYLMNNPEAGLIIRGSGGARKVRWSREGMGKSGGIRAIYFWAKAKDVFYMLTMYSKTERDNIDKKTLALIAKHLEDLI